MNIVLGSAFLLLTGIFYILVSGEKGNRKQKGARWIQRWGRKHGWQLPEWMTEECIWQGNKPTQAVLGAYVAFKKSCSPSQKYSWNCLQIETSLHDGRHDPLHILSPISKYDVLSY